MTSLAFKGWFGRGLGSSRALGSKERSHIKGGGYRRAIIYSPSTLATKEDINQVVIQQSHLQVQPPSTSRIPLLHPWRRPEGSRHGGPRPWATAATPLSSPTSSSTLLPSLPPLPSLLPPASRSLWWVVTTLEPPFMWCYLSNCLLWVGRLVSGYLICVV